jgi:hypothetical protein
MPEFTPSGDRRITEPRTTLEDMSKQSKTVTISVDAHAKRRLENASKAMAEVASAAHTSVSRSRRR